MDQDDAQDEQIVSAKIEGVSTRALAKQYGCTGRDIERIVDARLDYELDNRQRLRLVKLSVERIMALMAPFFERATKDKDVAAGTLCCKLEERLAFLLGLDHPTQARVDVYAVERQQQPTRYDRITEAIMRIAHRERFANNGNGPPLPEPPGGWKNQPTDDDQNRENLDEVSTPKNDAT